MSSSRTSKVLALSLGKGLTTVVSLVSGMLMARILSKDDLATYRQTKLAYDIALPLLGLGINQGIYYFLPTEKRRARGVVVDGLIMMLTMGLLYAIFIALGGNHILAKRFTNPAIVKTLVYLVPLPIVMLPAGLLGSVMVVQNKVNTLAIFNVASNFLLTASIITGCLLWKTPEAMILVFVGASIVTGIISIFLLLKSLPSDDWHPRFSNMRTMVKFSIPLVLASAAGTIALQLDKIIVSSMCMPAEYAVYSTGAIEIPVVGIITGSIASIILPDLRRMAASGNNTGAVALFRNAASRSATYLIPLTVFLLIAAKPFILTLFSSKYTNSVTPFRLYLLILPLRVAQYGPMLTALGLTNIIMIRSWAGMISNCVLSIFFVYLWGYIGAIIATIVTLYGVNFVWNMSAISKASQTKWMQIFPFKEIGILAMISIFAGLPGIVILKFFGTQVKPVFMLGMQSVIFAVTLIFLARLLKITPLIAELNKQYNFIKTKISSLQKKQYYKI